MKNKFYPSKKLIAKKKYYLRAKLTTKVQWLTKLIDNLLLNSYNQQKLTQFQKWNWIRICNKPSMLA